MAATRIIGTATATKGLAPLAAVGLLAFGALALVDAILRRRRPFTVEPSVGGPKITANLDSPELAGCAALPAEQRADVQRYLNRRLQEAHDLGTEAALHQTADALRSLAARLEGINAPVRHDLAVIGDTVRAQARAAQLTRIEGPMWAIIALLLGPPVALVAGTMGVVPMGAAASLLVLVCVVLWAVLTRSQS